MSSARKLVPLAILLALGACAAEPPLGNAMIVLPGQGKDQTAFQQDDQVCRTHATAHTGYTGTADPAKMPNAPGFGPAQLPDPAGYYQCMAARGDTVAPDPLAYAAAVYPYDNGWYDAYGYPYDYGYPFALYGGFGWYGGGWHHDGWHGGGFHHGGWHGYAGGWHGGPGFARGGIARGGFARGGFAGGGLARGGGGHR